VEEVENLNTKEQVIKRKVKVDFTETNNNIINHIIRSHMNKQKRKKKSLQKKIWQQVALKLFKRDQKKRTSQVLSSKAEVQE
jgi:hypothetical protein